MAKDLDGAETLVQTSRWLAARSSRQERALVSALIGYAQRLADLGRHEEAADALDEAVSIGQRNVVDEPAEYEINLAIAECCDEALPITEESVRIRRRLAQANPQKYESELAVSLRNLGIVLSKLDRETAACAATEEADVIDRRNQGCTDWPAGATRVVGQLPSPV